MKLVKAMNRIKDLRMDHDLSQQQVAESIGVTQRKYSYYETGAHALTAEFVVDIARFYQTSADYVLGLTNIKRPYPRGKNPKDPLDPLK